MEKVGRGNHGNHHKTHGYSQTKLYKVYSQMKRRCNNPKDIGYKTYGGAGISVCEEWVNSPESFIVWANSNGYKEGLEIDRIENSGNYEPSNCQWITGYENRTKDSIVIKGKILDECIFLYEKGNSLRSIGKELGLTHPNISIALKKKGISIRENFTEDDLSEMIEAHLVGGVSLRQIERHSNITRHTLSNYIKKAS